MSLPDVENALEALTGGVLDEAIRRVRSLLSGTPRPIDHDQYVPGHLTASAFVVSPDLSRILLVHHAKLGLWVQPGGHVESGDSTHEAAARREVSEECGLHTLESLGPIDLDIHVFPARGEAPEHLHFDLRWAFVSGSVDAIVGDGVSDVRWFDFGEVAGFDRSVSRPVNRLAGSLARRT